MATTKLLYFPVIGSLLCISCGGGSAPRIETSPPRGVTQNLSQGHDGTIYIIDYIGTVASPTGKSVSAPASQPLPVIGWAVYSPKKTVASNVDVVIDDIPYAAHYGLPRKDVAQYLKDNSYENCGFSFSMPAGALAKGNHTLMIRVVASDGKSYIQSPGIPFILE